MRKPNQAGGYSKEVTEDCERVLVVLLHGICPWKDSVYLVGGLTPRYLTKAEPPQVPPHVGTTDIDIVVELQMLAKTEAYHSFEKNFKKMGFERCENDEGEKVSWRWKTESEVSTTIILELLADDPNLRGGKVQPLPTEGNISALNIPHSSMVFDYHEVREIRAELPGDNGVAVELLRHADVVSFICLKSFALNERNVRKDAYDIVYCLEHYKDGWETVVGVFQSVLESKYKDVVQSAMRILQSKFADDDHTEGYAKNGPVSVAKFEMGESMETREARILRQRKVADIIMHLLREIGA